MSTVDDTPSPITVDDTPSPERLTNEDATGISKMHDAMYEDAPQEEDSEE